jgi:hypothetical protein
MNETAKVKAPMTMIRIRQETREKLKYVGKKGESYDEIISRLFYVYLTDEQGNNNTAEYEQQRLLRGVKSRTDEELQKLIADADALIKDFRGRGERWENVLQTHENDTLEQLIWCIEEMSLSVVELKVLGVLIDKKLAETELLRRAGEL